MALGLVLALMNAVGAVGSVIKGSYEDKTVRNAARQRHEQNGSYPIYFDSRTSEYRNVYTGVVEDPNKYREMEFNNAWAREKEFVLKEDPNVKAVCTHKSRQGDPIIGMVYKDINNPNKEYFVRGFQWEKDDLTKRSFPITPFKYFKGCCQAEFYMDRTGQLISLSDECKKYLEKHNWSSGEDDMKYYGTKEDIMKFMNYVNKKQKGMYGYLVDYRGDAFRIYGNNYDKLLLANKYTFYMNEYSTM